MKSFFARLQSVLFVLLVSMVIIASSASFALASGPITASDPASIGQSKHLTMMIVYASIAIFVSFLCSVAEAVVLSITPSYIANLKNKGNMAVAKTLGTVKSNIDQSLAAILTLNTIAHTVGAGGAGAEAAAYFGDKYVGISMAILTLLILFLSEIIPKTIGAVYWRSLAPITGRGLQWLIFLLYPLLLISEFVTRWLTQGKGTHHFSRDEFQAMVEVGTETGHFDENESKILSNLFRFPTLTVEDIMTPRTVVFTLQEDTMVSDAIVQQKPMIFSRIPIYAKNRDEVTGFVLKTDLLITQAEGAGNKTPLSQFKRKIRAVPESAKLSALLQLMLDKREHILLVLDEHGGFQGIVTLEDIVETLIGAEIVDECDSIDDMRLLARKKWEDRISNLGISLDDIHIPSSNPKKNSQGEKGSQAE